VKALIDAGTCASVTTTSTICGSSSLSSSYYETFVYNNYRVVIISGVPNHAAEYNQTKVNPNTRCETFTESLDPILRYNNLKDFITQ
jgi:hypothetical protein